MILEIIQDVKVNGKDEVVFELSSGSADFPFAVSDYHLPIMPAKDGKLDWASGNGTGPFKLERFDPGVTIEAKRDENYYGTAYFDEVTMLMLLHARTH